MNRLAYVRGKDDYTKGKELTDNPYRFADLDSWSAWRSGWLDMEASD
jgi:hypothetical protein